MADIVIIALVIAYCVFLFVRHMQKKKNGTGGCSGCCGDCSACCGGVPLDQIIKDPKEDPHG